MSGITIDHGTEEEWVRSADPHIVGKSDEEKREIQEMLREAHSHYELSKNWKKWVAWSKNHTSHQFLFREEEVPDEPRLMTVILIHVAQIAWMLQKHYSIFSRELQRDLIRCK